MEYLRKVATNDQSQSLRKVTRTVITLGAGSPNSFAVHIVPHFALCTRMELWSLMFARLDFSLALVLLLFVPLSILLA